MITDRVGVELPTPTPSDALPQLLFRWRNNSYSLLRRTYTRTTRTHGTNLPSNTGCKTENALMGRRQDNVAPISLA